MKTSLTYFLLFIPIILSSQDWKILGTDPVDPEATGQFIDIVEVAYLFESDSISFRIVIDTSAHLFTPNFGLAFALDTNAVLLDGMEDFESTNTDIAPDVVYDYLTNIGFPTFLPSAVKYISETKDSAIFQVNYKDWDESGVFNFVVGAVTWNFSDSHFVSDVAPDNGVYSIDIIDKTIELYQDNLVVLPNPTSDFLYIKDVLPNTQYFIFDLQGVLVSSGLYENEISLEHLLPGAYTIGLGSQSKLYKFIKL